jgi:hypothetical protein
MFKINELGNVRINVKLGRFLTTIFAVEKQKYYILCVCVCVALVIQHAIRMRRIVAWCLLRSTIFFYIIS